MEEIKISFETAKLAKEKGFNIPTISYYTPEGYCTESEGYQTERLEESNWNDGQGSYPTSPEEVDCSAPTQSLLQKWLREKHKIHIEPQHSWLLDENEKTKDDVVWWYYIYPNYPHGDRSKTFSCEIGEPSTYEEALEHGLQEGLKLI
jgi:hypothetical protein